MKIIGNCITFYSIPENFRKEKYGSKPNTVRSHAIFKTLERLDDAKDKPGIFQGI